jgi:hypothetical protein
MGRLSARRPEVPTDHPLYGLGRVEGKGLGQDALGGPLVKGQAGREPGPPQPGDVFALGHKSGGRWPCGKRVLGRA